LIGVIVARVIGSAEQADRLQIAGLLVGLIGVGTLVGLDLGELDIAALLEVLAVVVGYAVAPVIMARRLSDLPSIPVVSASLIVVAVAYAPYALLRWPSRVTGQQIAAVGTLALVCTAFAFVLFFALIAAIGPARAVVITYVNPAVAILVGVTTLGERFTLGMAIGFPLILCGSVLAARRRALPDAAVPEGAAGEALADDPQSIRASPPGVSNTAASTPVPSPSASGGNQSTSMPSSG
jgi:drug/metabolite transporter (DMT)-like permease